MNLLKRIYTALHAKAPNPPRINSALKQSDKALSDAINNLVTVIQDKKKGQAHEH